MQANIGVIDANPSSTAGVIEIMSQLHQYVPQKAQQLRVIPTHGDCMAVERMVDAKRARACDTTPANRLEGLEPTPQEFHHRGLMLQVGLSLRNVEVQLVQ